MELFNIDLTGWWLQNFFNAERELIVREFTPNKMGLIGQYDKEPLFTVDSFNIKDEAIIPFLESLSVWLRKYDKISKKIYAKFLEVSQLDPLCEVDLLLNDKAYRNWIILRHLTLYSIHCQLRLEVKSVEFNYGNYDRAPDICKELSGKSFSFIDDRDIIFSHWEIYKPTCRCTLLPNYEGILIE
ncbi:hypothetical protein AMD27_06980 [Acinetobacter sp. TGL-Y2]|uniref:hypothetical protein n=1 Tax=Acinetobacter sp. TGL-Y2 TaxID=1407071 RepID=UPI0007A657AF|nr:hypothetical protein [Acinetobacter sp. TGL-Y2]AMW78653.1 hypothetical protein AMD27_06980 [Acinetobacter sp. TGL-Y2]